VSAYNFAKHLRSIRVEDTFRIRLPCLDDNPSHLSTKPASPYSGTKQLRRTLRRLRSIALWCFGATRVNVVAAACLECSLRNGRGQPLPRTPPDLRRCRSMMQHVSRSTYDAIYASTRSDLRGWSAVAVSDQLRRKLSRANGGEAVWAAIDAVTDMLGGIPSPDLSHAPR
jgi:hypothetical protein